MLHDSELLDALSRLAPEPFDRRVYRATGVNADPTAASASGGRWAPPSSRGEGISVLNTSLDRHGAITEVAAYLSLLDPVTSRSPDS